MIPAARAKSVAYHAVTNVPPAALWWPAVSPVWLSWWFTSCGNRLEPMGTKRVTVQRTNVMCAMYSQKLSIRWPVLLETSGMQVDMQDCWLARRLTMQVDISCYRQIPLG